MIRNLVWIVSVLFIAACSSGPIKEQPRSLPSVLPSEVTLQVQWWRILAPTKDIETFGQLRPTILDETIYVPTSTGLVIEVNQLGKVLNQTQIASSITAPLVIDNEQILVLTGEGDLKLLDLSYNEVWSLQIGAISTVSAIATPERIFVQTIDGRINAIERITGRLLWVYQDAEPKLTVTGTSEPLLISTARGVALVTGLANGKVVALNLSDGAVIWEYRIARASGKTDVSRLVDVDAKPAFIDGRIVIAGYQGDMVVIEAETGRVLRASEFSSYRSIQSNGDHWYGVNSKSHIVALHPFTLVEQWRSTDFEYRQISEVLIVDDYLYAADAEGFLHVLNAATGQWLTSRHIDWQGTNSDPVAYKDGVLLQGNSTRLKYLVVKE